MAKFNSSKKFSNKKSTTQKDAKPEKPSGFEKFLKKKEPILSHQQIEDWEKKKKTKKIIPKQTNTEQILPQNKFSKQKNIPSKLDVEAPTLMHDMRLNKYLSNAGVASRRKADELIQQGLVTVNDKVIIEMGHKVAKEDVVKYENKIVRPEKKVYILMNKPKDFITTTHDEKGRKTVFDLLKNITEERVYPVGRLDRNTTGLILFTNDGDLTLKLTHPRYLMKKIYAAELDKPLLSQDLDTIRKGIVLEEGTVIVDDIQYADPHSKNIIGIEIHIGWNRIVRRIFEHLGYDVIKLDRVMYAGLTKKDLPRGKSRFLTEKEIIQLKHFVKG